MIDYKTTPIVAVTAYAMTGDKEKFLKAGCSHYISKPFSLIEFKSLIYELLENRKINQPSNN